MEQMTHSIRYWQPLERAFDRMRRFLFEPFDLVTWMVLGFSAWLATLGSGSGGGGNLAGDPTDIGESFGRAASSLFDNIFLFGLVGMAGIVVLAVVAVLLWLSSRGKFIFLDNCVHERAEISNPWHHYKDLGNSLFLWRVAFVGVVIAVLAAAALIPAIPAALISGGSFDDLSIFAMSSWGVFFGLAAVVVVIISLFVSLFLDAFVVPIMYRFNLGAVEAWQYLVPWLKAHTGSFVLYGFFVLLLTIGFAIVSMLACLLTCCIAALPYIGTVVLLPLWVTYRHLSLEWLAQFDPAFDVFTPLETAGAEEAIVVSGSEV